MIKYFLRFLQCNGLCAFEIILVMLGAEENWPLSLWRTLAPDNPNQDVVLGLSDRNDQPIIISPQTVVEVQHVPSMINNTFEGRKVSKSEGLSFEGVQE
jgi:hypothetical protein